MFLIGCYTGQRYSDYSIISSENIKKIEGVEYIVRVSQKTDTKTIIPIHPVVRKILIKYSGNIPKSISNQKTNENIKEICKIAGFYDKITLTEYKGGRKNRTDTEVEKWKLASTHTARRSFATNMYLAGDTPIRSIMAITGHKSEKSFMQYIVLNNQEHTNIVSKSSFFN